MPIDPNQLAPSSTPDSSAQEELRFETLTDGTAFAALENGWDDLVRAMDRPSPFLLHAWLQEWWRHYGDDYRLRVELAWRGPRLVGALPLCVGRRRGLEVVEFMGGHRSALGDLLLAKGEDESVPKGLAARAGTSGHDLADLFGLPANSRLAQALPPEALRLIERVEAPILDIADGWDEVYKRKTSSRTRQLHRRRRRQLSEHGRLEESVATTAEELETALRHAFLLHELRWAGRPDGSEFTTPRGKQFHLAAVLALAPDGIPRIVTLTLDDRPIAFHYFFALCGRMYVHRLAFDPEFARFSPGLLNTLDAIAAAGEDGLTTVEFLGGAERYKVELSDRLGPLYQGLGLAGSARGRFVVASRLTTIQLRLRLKRSRAVHSFYLNRLGPVRRAWKRIHAGSSGESGTPKEPHA